MTAKAQNCHQNQKENTTDNKAANQHNFSKIIKKVEQPNDACFFWDSSVDICEEIVEILTGGDFAPA